MFSTVGGVSRLPTLTLTGEGCETLVDVMYFCDAAAAEDICDGGGGSSKLGRLEAAGRLAVSGGCEA